MKQLRTKIGNSFFVRWGTAAWILFSLVQATHAWFGQDEYFNNFAAIDSLGAPLITPTQSDITLEVHSNFTLRCEAKRAIKWEIPDLFDIDLNYKVENYPTRDPDRPFGSQLTLYNVTANNVRYYYCMDENAEIVDDFDDLITQFKASKIYVFVNDLDNLLVPHGHPIITAFQYSDVVIPCKPTSKEIDVELLSSNGESYVSDANTKFDAKIGFIVKILHITDQGIYVCRPFKPAVTNEDEEIHFSVHMLPSSTTQFVNKPKITSTTKGHALDGESFNLTCSVEVAVGVMFTINWATPNDNVAKKENRAFISDTVKETSPYGQEIGKSVLRIDSASKIKDAGFYNCQVEDHNGNTNQISYLITVLGKQESYINLSEPTGHYLVKVSAGKAATMLAYFRGYPQPTLTWYNNKNTTISVTSEKYNVTQTDHDISLKVKSTSLEDSGSYYLRASNGLVEKVIEYKLLVKDKPKIKMNSVYIQNGEQVRMKIKTNGYPKPKLKCSFTPCKIKPNWPTCDDTKTTAFLDNQLASKQDEETYQEFEIKFTPTEPGVVQCSATNAVGKGDGEAEVLIGDLVEPVVVLGVDDDKKIAVGDDVSLTCAALAYNYSASLFWYRDDVLVETDPGIEVLTSQSEYSYKKILKFKNIQHEHRGLYECRAHPIVDDKKYEHKVLSLVVYDPMPPSIDTTNLESAVLDRSLGDFLWLECKASGIPKPMVTWYKDGEQVVVNVSDTRMYLKEDGTVLEIPFIKPEDEGTYKCLVSNRLDTVEKSTQLKISDMPGIKTSWIVAIGVIFFILMIFIIYLCIRIARERKLRRELKAAGLANFEEGAVECINPALSLDEQAEMLPYDRRFEFPKEKLKLGKQLGAGAFGVVLKAMAEGIVPEEKETTVAVKMVKKTADNEVIRALVSELKIMVHLGQHLNVVNLLGAVTKDIAKREIMVIVEYCRYGNLQNFLQKNRKRFVNQINPQTDQIDPSIITPEQRWSSDYEYNSKSEGGSRPNTQGYIRRSDIDYIGSHIDSCNTEQTLITSVPEGELMSNNSVQPAWRSNYKPDDSLNMDITTTHLVSWAFQVARGMDYLASRKVLHGDLAARNILLCDDNVVKICDFGLARTMYKSDNYKKQGESLLPIKWLALESLGDQVFSTYSDIWSFGIVLWEFFSLAKVPYPGMAADQSLYLKLKDGYRMAKPDYANQELYDIMLECWGTHPESRPLFDELEKKLGKLLEDEVSNHYIDLNEPYLRMNSEYMKTGQTDYLALMGCPEENAPSAPGYVNGHLLPDIKVVEPNAEYLKMSPKTGSAIFSPRPQNDYVIADRFKFPEPSSPTISNNLDSPMSKNRKKAGIPEEIPMLKHSLSDSESEISPDPRSAVTTFSKLNRSREDIEAQPDATDNYVNVQPSGNHNKSSTKDAFSNPSYLMLQSVNETRN